MSDNETPAQEETKRKRGRPSKTGGEVKVRHFYHSGVLQEGYKVHILGVSVQWAFVVKFSLHKGVIATEFQQIVATHCE
jgi:hypothetical protein